MLLCVGIESQVCYSKIDMEQIARHDDNRLNAFCENNIGFIALN
jgi:hypothetical protein